MLLETIERSAENDAEAVLFHKGALSWRQLAQQIDRLSLAYEGLAARRVGLSLAGSPTALATLVVLERLRCDTFLLPGELSRSEGRALAERFRLGALLMPVEDSAADRLRVEEFADADLGGGAATVTILTSGSTGQPKAVRHDWASLSRPVRVQHGTERPRWLLTYRPHLYAGLQVILQCLGNAGTLVVPPPRADAQTVAELAARAGVRFASATPSYWRWLLTFARAETLDQVPLAQITMGGEVATTQVLDALRRRFPSARLAHVYATTELGRCFSVTDGRAGFPSRFLNGPSADGVELKIDNGELLARSANAMQGYDRGSGEQGNAGGWFPTGDLVEVVGDRVLFRGRDSDIINVGGNKVHPLEVEQVIRDLPEVADARVFGKSSSIAGQLVACEIVPAAGLDPEAARAAVNAQCLARLAPHQRPRLINLVPRIGLSDAGKALKRALT